MKMHNIGSILLVLAAIVVGRSAGSTVSAQAAGGVVASSTPQPTPARSPTSRCDPPTKLDNGIAVGAPKIYDHRTLTLRLESLQNALGSVRFIDQKSIAANLQMMQGFQQRESASSISVQGPPLPGIVEKTSSGQTVGTNQSSNESTTGTSSGTTTASGISSTTGTSTTSGSTSGSQVTDTSTASRDVTTAARQPVNPALPAGLGAPSYTPQFGINASDVLTDQINITYQIFNLQMLLEGALSDRLYDGRARRQAVLGFNISIDPPAHSEDSAAFVEVSVSVPSKHAVEIVGLMPAEKTYNSANLSTKANAFGGSAISQMFSVGANTSSKSQIFYLVRDNDTISFERSGEDAGITTFGWAFRPVLGRRSVSPGSRQMFAVVSLPERDSDPPQALTVQTRTYWRRYNRTTMITEARPGFWRRFVRFASLATSSGSPRKDITCSADALVLVPTTSVESALTAKVADVSWEQTGLDSALVTISGDNFFTGTEVHLGGRVYRGGDGLTFQSAHVLTLAVPVSALAAADASVVGRYGRPVPLSVAGEPFSIVRTRSLPARGGRHTLEIDLTNGGKYLTTTREPVVTLEGAVIPPPFQWSTEKVENKEITRLTAFPPVKAFPTLSGLLTVKFPFRSAPNSSSRPVYSAAEIFEVTRLNGGRLMVSAPVGYTFTTEWKVDIGGVKAPTDNPPAVFVRSGVLLEIVATSEELEKYPVLLIQPPDAVAKLGALHRLVIPSDSPATPSFKITDLSPARVGTNSAQSLLVGGEGLSRIASVTADGQELEFRTKEKDKKVEVFLNRNLTKNPGVISLVFRSLGDAVLGTIDLTIQRAKE